MPDIVAYYRQDVVRRVKDEYRCIGTRARARKMTVSIGRLARTLWSADYRSAPSRNGSRYTCSLSKSSVRPVSRENG